MSFIYLAVEDELSEAVGKKIIKETVGEDISIQVLRKNGFGYLKSKLENFVEMSKHQAVLMITDLDNKECAPNLKADWFGALEQPDKFVFRVAVREIESWILADKTMFAEFLGVSASTIPLSPEALDDPKASLVNVAKRARRKLRDDIVPDRKSNAKQGLGYNRALCPFVEKEWSVDRASQNSDSLKRTRVRMSELATRMKENYHA